jgi:hypothetical protein
MQQVEIYEKANKTDQCLKVVIAYTAGEMAKAQRVFTQIDKDLNLPTGTTAGRVVLFDARFDNKASASKA